MPEPVKSILTATYVLGVASRHDSERKNPVQRLTDEIAQLSNDLRTQNREPVDRLLDALNQESPMEEFQRVQALVMRVTDGFMKRGWPPLRLQASYFSQNGPKSYFEVNWLRTDLLASIRTGSSRTTTSHGPGYRLVISGQGLPTVQMQSRHNIEARDIFIKNVLSPASSLWIERCLTRLRRANNLIRWTDDLFSFKNLDELQYLARIVHKSKKFNSLKYSSFAVRKGLEPNEFEDEARLSRLVVNFFAKTAPLFWAHHIILEPKAARTAKHMRGQISREQLRREVLRLERKCQHVNCPLNGGDPRKLKMAHLTPKINLLSNVIALCPLCYEEQFPATSVILIESEAESSVQDRRQYVSEIQTRDGPKSWQLNSHIDHPLSNPRSG